MSKNNEKVYVATQDILIPAGTVFRRGPEKTEYCAPHYEAIIGLGKDHSGVLVLDGEAIKKYNFKFAKLRETVDICA